MIDPTRTVRDLALQTPNATRVSEPIKIDLERLLESSAGPEAVTSIDFQQLTLAELITHILDTHHAFVRNELVRLESLTAKVVTAHGENHFELLAINDLRRQLFDDLLQHMFKEEQILFPFLVELEQSTLQHRPAPLAPFGTVKNPIRTMMMEHDTAGEILQELRKLTGDYVSPADGCLTYQALYRSLEALEQDLHQHIHLENHILFPKAIAMEDTLIAVRMSLQSGNTK